MLLPEGAREFIPKYFCLQSENNCRDYETSEESTSKTSGKFNRLRRSKRNTPAKSRLVLL